MTIHDLQRQTAHIFDQNDAQGDGNRPDFADHQGLNLLIGPDIARKDGTTHEAVSMRDIGPGQAENPWIARERTFGQLWQLAVIPRWQVVADLTQLLFDKVKIVQKPFGGRGDRLTRLQGPRAGAIGPQENVRVFFHAAAERLHRQWLADGYRLCLCKALGVMLQPLSAKKV